MKRSMSYLLVFIACLAAVGFYRGWFTLSSKPEEGSNKVDVNLTMDRDKMEQDAETVKEKTTEFVGNVKAKRSIEIHAPGRVKGDLHTPVLQIDKGVVFEGRSFMEGAAKAGGAPAATKPPGPAPVK